MAILPSIVLSQQCCKVYFIGSIYFTANILAATDWLKLLCRQSNIQSRGMTQFE